MKAEINARCRQQDFDLVVNQFEKRGIIERSVCYDKESQKLFVDKSFKDGNVIITLHGRKEDILEFVFSLGFYTGKMFNF